MSACTWRARTPHESPGRRRGPWRPAGQAGMLGCPPHTHIHTLWAKPTVTRTGFYKCRWEQSCSQRHLPGTYTYFFPRRLSVSLELLETVWTCASRSTRASNIWERKAGRTVVRTVRVFAGVYLMESSLSEPGEGENINYSHISVRAASRRSQHTSAFLNNSKEGYKSHSI